MTLASFTQSVCATDTGQGSLARTLQAKTKSKTSDDSASNVKPIRRTPRLNSVPARASRHLTAR